MALSKKTYLATTLALIALVGAGCTSSRFGNNGGGNSAQTIMPMPGSSEVITQSTLMPPRAATGALTGQDTTGNYDGSANAANNNLANVNTTAQNIDQNTIPGFDIPTTAINLSPAMVAGVWHVSVDGMVCQLATPQTKFGKGFRAAPLRCPASFMSVTTWLVMGQQLNLYKDGNQLAAVLYSTTNNVFEGRSVEGQAVRLTR